MRSGGQAAFDEFDIAGEGRRPVRFTVDFKAVNANRLHFGKAYVAPFGHFEVAVENRESEKQVIAVIFRDIPVASADEEMKVDEFVFQGDLFGFIEARYLVKLLSGGRVPHGCFLSVKKVLRFQKSMYLLYHHITDLPVRQKPVKIGNKKSL